MSTSLQIPTTGSSCSIFVFQYDLNFFFLGGGGPYHCFILSAEQNNVGWYFVVLTIAVISALHHMSWVSRKIILSELHWNLSSLSWKIVVLQVDQSILFIGIFRWVLILVSNNDILLINTRILKIAIRNGFQKEIQKTTPTTNAGW